MLTVSFVLAAASTALLVVAAAIWGRARAGRLRALDRAAARSGRPGVARPVYPPDPLRAASGDGNVDCLLFPRWLLRLGGRLASPASRLAGPAVTCRYREVLTLAGEPPGLGPGLLLGMQSGLAAAGGVLGAALWLAGPGGLLLTLLLVTAGACYPWVRVYLLAVRRQEQIARELPDFLDLLAVALAAGAGLDTALSALAARLPGPLAGELRRYQGEVALGASRAEALRRLRERNRCRDLDWFVSTLAQAYALGTPLSDALAAEAGYLRKSRLARARERAAQAAPRMTLVTTLVATPGALLFFLGLLLLRIWDNPADFGLTGVFLGP